MVNPLFKFTNGERNLETRVKRAQRIFFVYSFALILDQQTMLRLMWIYCFRFFHASSSSDAINRAEKK